jgi:hypothetical protein
MANLQEIRCTNPDCKTPGGYKWKPRILHPKHCPECFAWWPNGRPPDEPSTGGR